MIINAESSKEVRESMLAVFRAKGLVDIKTFISPEMGEEEIRNTIYAYGHLMLMWCCRPDDELIEMIPVEHLPAFITEQQDLIAKYVMMGLKQR